ncbi:MAG: N-formylglutamate amidohydrolase [Planctomycetes bacterium]|nr:N-formylglutamate amidohydrolase [Planctomycetota bacterium]MBL7043234.1 N-formylglutamate amidohydrolase [Pirellulaceae bacterium]
MVNPTVDSEPIWRLHAGGGPLVATAIHDGNDVRDEVAELLALDDATRLREEDPFTAEWTRVAPTRVVSTRSRFEVDLNRPRDKAVYRRPDDAWGLTVWRDDPPNGLFDRSLAEYDSFYSAMGELLGEMERAHGRFVVYDLHSYNHRRNGSDGPTADPEGNPQVNIGTRTMDRERWGPVVDTFIETLRAFDFPGGRLDVRENVKFFGGNWPRWIHENFPDTGVALAIEIKKIFMDEWTGEPNRELIDSIGDALQSTVRAVLKTLRRI